MKIESSELRSLCLLVFHQSQTVLIFLLYWEVQVEDLARVSFKKAPLYIGVDDGRTKVLVTLPEYATRSSSPLLYLMS